MNDVMKEREQAIMNGIMSLVINQCDLFDHLRSKGGEELYEAIASKIRPTLNVYEEEAEQYRADLENVRGEVNLFKNALETIAANARSLPGGASEQMANTALGR